MYSIVNSRRQPNQCWDTLTLEMASADNESFYITLMAYSCTPCASESFIWLYFCLLLQYLTPSKVSMPVNDEKHLTSW